MHTNEEFISALESYCSDHGETLEDRESRLGVPVGSTRSDLCPLKSPQLNRNIRLVLANLQISTTDFQNYMN